ncbi:hypothetical protein [Pedobacter alpinus]|uniref:Acyl carrier protein phosphodiesterase n=1 Tax=Pedobacter alpinus TaxID=1590643 RepID=A0ABW5TPR2_9SPHI
MNFLSHYYFDRSNTNAYEVLGIVMPDLIKNVNKNWNIHPEKNEILFNSKPIQKSILKGWRRHLEVDKLFHNSDFFRTHQHQIKILIRESIVGSPVKPFFLGHISLELILDSLLITEDIVNPNKFYQYLDEINVNEISTFLTLNKIDNQELFLKFFETFKKEKYLFSYALTDKITYALKRICLRIWDQPFTPEQEILLTECLINYKNSLRENFIIIFDQIDAELN